MGSCHLPGGISFRSFSLLYAAFRLNAVLWIGGQHEYGILVPNLDRYHCLWRLDRRWHVRRRRAYGLGAHGTAYRHCGFDQRLSSSSRCQNRVAAPTVSRSIHLSHAADRRAGNTLERAGRSPETPSPARCSSSDFARVMPLGFKDPAAEMPTPPSDHTPLRAALRI
jgi:hypothetical protein